jgi:hypothetical protein
MKLICLSKYENRELAFNAGDVFEADEKLARLLFTDSPGSFQEYVPEPVQEFEVPDDTKVVRKRGRK